MSVIKRNERINELLRAQSLLLSHVETLGGTIRTKDARKLVDEHVTNQSRRVSVWTTVINAGYLQPTGKGTYSLTEAGKVMAKYWRDVFNPPNEAYNG